ncbi:hypothetical protein NL676_012765 [Syzygium grande]|nr:hypothetical protein NL676_012765 [Syzygium grande]
MQGMQEGSGSRVMTTGGWACSWTRGGERGRVHEVAVVAAVIGSAVVGSQEVVGEDERQAEIERDLQKREQKGQETVKKMRNRGEWRETMGVD